MANIKSARKRVIINENQRVKQQAFRSSMRSAIKEFDKNIDANNVDAAKNSYALAMKKVDKAASKNMIHKNAANRAKSRMHKRLSAVAQ